MSHRTGGLIALAILLSAGGLAAQGSGGPGEVGFGASGPALRPDAATGARAGTISPLTDSWRSISMGARFQNPVVIAGPPTHEGPHPGVLQIRNVVSENLASEFFEARFREWRYRQTEHDDISHRDEAAPFLVLELGRTEMPDGSVWLTGIFRLDGTKKWTEVTFDRALPAEPTVLLTLQTANGSHPVSVRARNVTQQGFEAALFEEEALDDGHRHETVAYLAIHSDSEAGKAKVNGGRMDYRLTNVPLTDQWGRVGPARLHIEEEKSSDEETGHTTERVDVLVLGSSDGRRVFAQQVTSRGGNPAALRAARAGSPGGSEAAEAVGWHLEEGTPSYSEVAGRKGEQTRRLNLGSEPMRMIKAWEVANRPCKLSVHGINGGEAAVECVRGRGAGFRSATLAESAIRALSVCTNENKGPFQKYGRVKGIAVRGNLIREDGSFREQADRSQFSRANCRGDFEQGRGSGEWEPMVRCGPRKVATGVVAHLELVGAGKRDLRGLQLICRTVVREFE